MVSFVALRMAMLKHAFAFGEDALAASYFINQICVLHVHFLFGNRHLH